MVCADLTIMAGQGIGGLLIYPTLCNHWFYAELFLAIFIIETFGFFIRDEEKYIKADLISSLAVSSIIMTVLSLIGTFITANVNGQALSMISQDIFRYEIAIMIILCGIWFFKE